MILPRAVTFQSSVACQFHAMFVRYFLNLVLVDEEDRRYFKQQEIFIWRQKIG